MSLLARVAWLALSASLVLVLPPVAAGARPDPWPESQKPGAAPRTGGGQKPETAVRRQPRPVPPRRTGPAHPVHRPPVRTIRGRVFIGGYFYDPYFGPYPWWQRPGYPYWYYPIYDERAELHLKVTPGVADRAAVYVDGFYAGIVDDFDGIFQSLALSPGGHGIVVYLEGYRTVRHNLYLQPGSSFTLQVMLQRLRPGERSEPPFVAPAVPPPPAGSYSLPATSPAVAARSAETAVAAAGYGTLDLFVQPENAQVMVDGQVWVSSEKGHFVVQMTAGSHRLEISRPGYGSYEADVEIAEGGATPLNVSLTRTP
jgi:PEGA domain